MHSPSLSPTSSLLWLSSLLGVLACGEPPGAGGGQFGQETDNGATCVEVERTPLADDEISALGFAPQELLSWAIADHAATLTWSDDTTTGLTLSLSNPSGADYVVYEAEYSGNTNGMETEAAIWLECPAMVEVTTDVALQTEDGAFDEAFSFTLRVTSADQFALSRELDAVSGSFDVQDWNDADYDEVWADLSLQASQEDGLAGAVEGSGQKTHGSGPDGSVSLTLFEIATIQGAGSGAEAD